MSKEVKMCFTCRKDDCRKLHSVQSFDTDKLTYLEKLKSCVTSELVEHDEMQMCGLCIKHLRISYKFQQTVLASQDCLRKAEEPPQDCEEYVIDCKPDDLMSGSDGDLVKSDNYSSDEYEKHGVDFEEKKRTKRKYKVKVETEILFCEYCGGQFAKKWQLRKHLARVHNEMRKFACPYCSKDFKQAYHLKEHITSHTGEKNYTCPICEKKFQRQSSQRRHVKSHDAPLGCKTKRTPFLCTICGKSFPFSNGVQRHMRIHLGIKNFECQMCSRKFTQSTHLQVHMRTHTGEKPYICDTCGEKFSLKSCMLKHMHNRHYRSKNLVEDMPLFYLAKDFEPDDIKEFVDAEIKTNML